MSALSSITSPFSAYLAPDGFTDDLVAELGSRVRDVYDRLVIADGAPAHAVWAENIWRNPQFIEIESIGDAAKKLRAIQRSWANYAFDFHRRSRLITEKLPHISGKPLVFGKPLPTSPLGSWTLIDDNLMLAASDCSSPVPNGAFIFEENKEEPPNRAYLKLWESLTRLPRMPQAGETCLDLGACPGGWTWVLQKLGATVISVDKAPLAPHIAALPNVKYMEQSAFALKPADIGQVDWLFSDIICYPERLLRLVSEWKASGLVKNFVCTIKFQGETDFKTTESFLEIAGSTAFHLYNNKHEITWVCLE
ncbi:MAG TPA: SAM-dependent methyltransferase [Alphaproteobacteria bacterium]|nr:SAM-dependent methyltransferase [Alphaproteobacteria bacterium]